MAGRSGRGLVKACHGTVIDGKLEQMAAEVKEIENDYEDGNRAGRLELKTWNKPPFPSTPTGITLKSAADVLRLKSNEAHLQPETTSGARRRECWHAPFL
jgi:hypothetical protein